MFYKYIINFENNLFDELANSVKFEDITKGRKGAVLVNPKDGLMPLVRTTTGYKEPAQTFSAIHYRIIESIKKMVNNPKLEFNNAMVEIYDSAYRTMGFHTDQSLDLADDSYICIFSCYNNVNETDNRKLKIRNKITGNEHEIIMEHNSAIMFSVADNSKHQHKIILDKVTTKDRLWLGITFRLSKTFIKFVNNVPHFHPSNIMLQLATNDERREFMKHKGNENQNTGYAYPDIHYTISQSDMLPTK